MKCRQLHAQTQQSPGELLGDLLWVLLVPALCARCESCARQPALALKPRPLNTTRSCYTAAVPHHCLAAAFLHRLLSARSNLGLEAHIAHPKRRRDHDGQPRRGHCRSVWRRGVRRDVRAIVAGVPAPNTPHPKGTGVYLAHQKSAAFRSHPRQSGASSDRPPAVQSAVRDVQCVSASEWRALAGCVSQSPFDEDNDDKQ